MLLYLINKSVKLLAVRQSRLVYPDHRPCAGRNNKKGRGKHALNAGPTAIALFSLVLQGATCPAFAQTGHAEPVCIELGSADTAPLEARVGPADPEVIAMFAGTGASNIATHDLTMSEEERIRLAFARLPRLHREVLQRHLNRISFLSLTSGAGSALTRKLDSDDATPRFDITFRASLLDEDLTTFLNTKEARLFHDDGSGVNIAFDAGESDALTYVLFHEATHIVDQVAGLTDEATDPLRAGIWTDLRSLAEPYSSAPYARTIFRSQPPIPLSRAPKIYRSLQMSPFVSLYATAAMGEDVAELFAWHQLWSRFGQGLTLTIGNREGQTLFRYQPLEIPGVQARFAEVQALVERYDQTCGPA
ncbi:hypothetical protein GEU84_015970 [Fertoebacter nigrum]|uniref:Uncharacterized protein n=1 Tax=Fertoeibacter niger TaxID=2656921 RepID=A0A8X8GX05_9RHOB|nr:hypothetical protein [Fertoeibacter niger]NUB45894.1 hypothetical protein [Fertoeibacter niger]